MFSVSTVKKMGRLAALLIAGAGFSMQSSAQLQNLQVVQDRVKESITAGMSQVIPDFEIEHISRTPAAGLYSVQVKFGPKVFVNEQGNFIVNQNGQAIQIVDGQFAAWLDPAEQQREEEIQRIAKTSLNKIPKDELIVYPAKGETKSHVFVFTDVDCGYCVKLHREVPKLNEMGIEVRYLAYPRSGPIGSSADKLAQAFCADDRGEALTALKNGGGKDLAVCAEHPVKDHYKLVQALGLRGTPGIFLPDGTKISGYLPAENLAELLDI